MPSLDEQALERTLPRHCYLADAFFAQEREHIFAPEWFCVARSCDFERSGDYRVVSVGGENIVIVRDGETVRGFHNVCRHRGAELVPVSGTATISGHFNNAIRCRYHSWRYSLDGRLTHTPHVEICTDDVRLHTVEVDCWGGFVFVRSGATGGATLIESLGAIATRTQRYPLADLVVGHSIRYSVDANWKVILENYNECYHCAGVHPELCKVVPAFRENGGSGLDWDRGIPHRDGANTFTFSGTTNRAPFPGLNADEKTRHKGELIYPNLMLSLAMDHVAAFLLFPRGPARTEIRCDFLFHPDAVAAADYDPSDAVDFWDITNRQDWAICESVQRGMNSSTFTHGYYAPMEDLSLDIREYVRARVPIDSPA